MDFAISDQAYAKARIPVTDSVNLWLGANVMLEYPLEEAKALLVSMLLMMHGLLAATKQVYDIFKQLAARIKAEAIHVFNVQAHNIHNCKENLKQNQRDLELVKDSITTVEVQLLLP